MSSQIVRRRSAGIKGKRKKTCLVLVKLGLSNSAMRGKVDGDGEQQQPPLRNTMLAAAVLMLKLVALFPTEYLQSQQTNVAGSEGSVQNESAQRSSTHSYHLIVI